ncbi:DUF6447 family protein [Roseicyclus mahoneyensis]|jgi:hypothetical protein|uniref:Uncharacterized protein n=1 Tax=Roseicyclus mahoneyensis TaxID=164332 RepID=A0A316GKK3_9RHOB|nr:DUF6447 family protein [Roseicyclus mahoneyensis]PWK61322.1 hypothetical protein C7455_1027 [Roseicyclus mahoneyensis]
MSDTQIITIDGIDYNLDNLTEKARLQIQNIRFCDQQIRQLQNEWAIADTARLGYANALRREVEKHKI